MGFELRTRYTFTTDIWHIHRVCWAQVKKDSKSLLYLTGEGEVNLTTLLPDNNSGESRSNIGIRWNVKVEPTITGVCAWSSRERVAVGMDNKAALLDLDGHNWDLATSCSDVLAQTFNEVRQFKIKLHNGTECSYVLNSSTT